jgi:cellulose synthase/poly-beta-1,6-N-acetylglucosamine synthase-like glycosyltransferase
MLWILYGVGLIFFWVGLGLVLYVHIFHPMFLIGVGLFKKCYAKKRSALFRFPHRDLPKITLLISAYNEEAIIESKIINSYSLDYPKDKLEIIVVSDGSTDRTDEIVQKITREGIILCRVEGRLGKNACQNIALEKTTGEIVVFSDATSMYRKDAIQKLVEPFRDPRVGGVVGRLILIPQDATHATVAREESIFVRFSQWLKGLEHTASMPVGASGSIFAIRTELTSPLPNNVADDLIRPLEVVRRGYHLRFSPEAVAVEQYQDLFSDIMDRKVRSGRRAVLSLKMEHKLLNPLKYGIFSIQFLTKTLLRRLLFPSLLMLLSGAFILFIVTRKPLYFFMVSGLLAFGLVGLLGAIHAGKRQPKKSILRHIDHLVYYYLLVTYGAFKGIILGLRGKHLANWQPARKEL